MSAAALDGVLALYRAGRVQEALAEGQALVRRHPGDPRAHHLVGTLLMALGRAGDAISSLRAAIRLQPENIQPRLQLALALHQLARLEEAAVSYRRVLAWSPATGDAHCNLGLIESAVHHMARAVALSPDHPSMLGNLGALAGSQRLLRRALALGPGEAGIHLSLGNRRRTQGNLESALVAYRRARDCGRPGEAMANLALAASDLGRSDEALRWMRCSIAFTPSEPSILSNAAQIGKGKGWIAAAIDLARRSLACAATAEAWNNLGDSLQATGDVGGALVAYRRSVELGGSAAWHSNLVFCLCYDERVTSEALFGEVRAWAARHAPKTGSKPMRRAVSGRPRVGVLSSDLRDHPVGRNVLGVFEHHRRVSLHGYAEVAREDATTARFRSHAEGWTSTVGMGDEQVAERMRKDGLDLLIVLAGHTAKNRPLVAAFGGAPVQASFHDLTTSGLEAMDWWITDGVLHPEGTKERFTEKLWRLPHFYLHRPPDEAPDVGPLPSEAGGHITFVSCNNPAKLTDGVVRLWSQVLKGVPGSRLLLKYVGWFGDEVVRSRIVGRFEANGIGRERLDLRATDLVRKEQLGLLNEADIALDPFPFNGSTTTFEALWMGVPVVTLQGERFVGRVGASVLSALDLPELIASDEEAYVAAAVALAGNRQRLAGLRRSLRPRIAASPICDAAGYTRSVETALIEMAGG
jgi:predicted O-linked N-acetylglucosamine transferase (SPINDLY family)